MTSLVSSGATVNGIASLFKLLIGNHSFQFRVVDSPKTAENSLGATWWTLLFICTTAYRNFLQAPILRVFNCFLLAAYPFVFSLTIYVSNLISFHARGFGYPLSSETHHVWNVKIFAYKKYQVLYHRYEIFSSNIHHLLYIIFSF